jgi:L-alanine-DL-glutamate epimerase-like enolase superfamily enzyme
MKVTGLRTAAIALPLAEPLATSIHRIEKIGCLLVWLDGADGTSGEALLFALGTRRLAVFDAMVRSLAPLVVGRSATDRGAVWADMWADINFVGHKGVSLFAIAAIDTALWDLAGKRAGLSVGAMLGRIRRRVAAYASGGLWLSRSVDELQREAAGFVAQGFRAVKMRLGSARIADDVARALAIREAIGPDIQLMADANQGLTVDHAIALGRALAPANLAWFEEPVQAYDLDGSARVAAAVPMPVASGETEYSRYGFRDMIERRSAGVLMPDLQRVGGVTEFMRVAHIAAAWDLPVSPHVFTEYSLQLCAAIPHCPVTEHMPWFEPLYNERMEMADGDLLIPDRPGLGFTFDAKAVEKLRVD